MSKQLITNPFFDFKVEEIKTVNSGLIVNRKALVDMETDKVISVVGGNYNVVSNRELVKNFESYLAESDVKYQRMAAGVNRTGTQFWAKYRFPEIEANFGERKTNFGTVPDNVQLMMELKNSYDGTSTWGFDLGGYRLVCLNGLRVFEKIFRWSNRHVGDQEMAEEQILLNFETAKNLFQSKLAPSWEELTRIDFDKARAATILRSLELSKMYANWMGIVYKERLNNDTLKNMWDFYNMITWFTSHVVDQRNRNLARRISVNASQQLLGEVVL